MARALRCAALVAVAACHRGEPTLRDRLLGEIPGDVEAVIVADGPAIADPRVRGALDAVAAQWPAGMGCVLEAAYASEQVALSVDHYGDLALIIASAASAAEPKCPALSQRRPGWWVATIGAGPVATPTSVLDDDRFARARPFLRTAPIAAASLDDVHAIAAAQSEPLAAWLTLDGPDGTGEAIERAIAAYLARLRSDPAAAALVAKLRTTRGDNQVIVRLDSAAGLDLAAAARAVVALADGPAARDAPRFACPDPRNTACEGERLRVASLRTVLPLIVTTGQPAVVVDNGDVGGLRLSAAVDPLGLEAGDIVIAVAGRLVVSRAMFLHLASQAREQTSLTVRRGTTERVLDLVEH